MILELRRYLPNLTPTTTQHGGGIKIKFPREIFLITLQSPNPYKILLYRRLQHSTSPSGNSSSFYTHPLFVCVLGFSALLQYVLVQGFYIPSIVFFSVNNHSMESIYLRQQIESPLWSEANSTRRLSTNSQSRDIGVVLLCVSFSFVHVKYYQQQWVRSLCWAPYSHVPKV